MQKLFITPNRKWWAFCAASDNGHVGHGSGYQLRTSAIINMYSIFDKIGEGVICTIKIERPSGALTLSFDQRSLRFLKQYHIDPEQWLNEAYNYILRCDEFIVIDEKGEIDPLNNERDFMLIDTKGRIPTDDV